MSKQVLVVAGLTVNVFALSGGKEDESDGNLEQTPRPVAILFLLHGRTSKADHLELVAKALLDEVHTRRKGAGAQGPAHDLWVVTFVSSA